MGMMTMVVIATVMIIVMMMTPDIMGDSMGMMMAVKGRKIPICGSPYVV
jgi:hypothetical protein